MGSATGDTADVAPPAEVDAERLNLLIIGEGLIVTKALPAADEVQLGRSSRADVVIDDPSVSRAHALVSTGPPLAIRDLGSANGTRVGERELAPDEWAELAPGDVLRLGDTTVILQRRSPALRAQRVWSHEAFEARVEEECSRAERSGGRFAVARFQCRPTPAPRLLHEVLAQCARKSDVVGEYSPSEIEILLVETPPDEAQRAIERLTTELAGRAIEVNVGLARFPDGGRSSHELVQRASPLPVWSDAGRESADDAIVADPRMRDLYQLAERIAAGHIPALIIGETGVGKEILAERIHRASSRADNPYLRLNCAALSETLLESELFGHEKGAFTGATSPKPGLLESANTGTVFLDEIGELPFSLQVKLLRVLEEGSVLRVGGLTPRPLDVRFIAATNRDLVAEVERGTFRQDLYFRLNGATLLIPPLRERPAEIPALAEAFAAQAARQLGHCAPPALTEAARELLERYRWPGNIRELRNAIERAVLLCGSGPILPAHLPTDKMQMPAAEPSAPFAGRSSDKTPAPSPVAPWVGSSERLGEEPTPAPAREDDTREHVALEGAERAPGESERERILEALSACMGNQTAAAKRLGMARRTLVKKLDLYGISGPRKKR